MLDPTTMSPGSIMPTYPWIIDNDIDTSLTAAKVRVLQKLGTPYPKGYDQIATQDLHKQAVIVAKNLNEQGIKDPGLENKEIVALIAYLQRLGTDAKVKPLSTN